jgi:hypothetical protein
MELERIRDQRWTETAVAGELQKLGNLPEGENINKSDSIFFACLLKIAAIVKGTGSAFVSSDEALSQIQNSCSQYAWLKEKEIKRQWKNAYKMANPRFRPK